MLTPEDLRHDRYVNLLQDHFNFTEDFAELLASQVNDIMGDFENIYKYYFSKYLDQSKEELKQFCDKELELGKDISKDGSIKIAGIIKTIVSHSKLLQSKMKEIEEVTEQFNEEEREDIPPDIIVPWKNSFD